jgi:cyclopropane-fatty-acyl-phospholipid synthase
VVDRLENRGQEAVQFVTEPSYRVRQLFMSGSAYGFATEKLNVYQVLTVGPDEQGRSGLPLSRAVWLAW